jgi:rfaE bifunctional protein kinase chain/domain
MLTAAIVQHILERLPALTVGVVGDLFLDRYLDIDATLTEPSLETGLDAYQVVAVRSSPGAAGTIINNLVALGVGRVAVVAVVGDDGEGYELRQALRQHNRVDPTHVFWAKDRRTPTYTKPMLREPGRPVRELNRLDIKNRTPLPATAEKAVLDGLDHLWPQVAALLVLDQVSEADCGVVTARVRDRLAQLGEADPEKLILADSRERIGLFRSVWLKPNQRECAGAVAGMGEEAGTVDRGVRTLARRVGRPVYCTCGEQGILLAEPNGKVERIPAWPVQGPIDVVGAGDSTSAGIACALAAGASRVAAAAFGNLVASITIQQIGTTGTATPEQVGQRWRELETRFGAPSS